MKIKYTVNIEAAANKYLKVIDGKDEYLFEEIANRNSKYELAKNLKEYKYLYKSKLYTYQDVLNYFKSNSDKLKFPEIHKDLMVPDEANLFIINQDLFASTYKAKSFEETLGRARFNLIKSLELFYDPIDLNWDTGYGPHYKIRTLYIENSIIDYNQCMDFLIQMWWFAFGFYKYSKGFNSEMDYRKLSGLCSKNEMGVIAKEHLNDTKSNAHWNKFNKFCGTLYKVNSWANEIKHRGNLRIEGIYIEDGYEVKLYKDSVIKSTKDYMPIIVDLEDIIKELMKIHEMYIDCYEFTVNRINFRKAISIYKREFETTGQRIMIDSEKYSDVILK